MWVHFIIACHHGLLIVQVIREQNTDFRGRNDHSDFLLAILSYFQESHGKRALMVGISFSDLIYTGSYNGFSLKYKGFLRILKIPTIFKWTLWRIYKRYSIEIFFHVRTISYSFKFNLKILVFMIRGFTIIQNGGFLCENL